MRIRGRIVNFVYERQDNGYAKFVFKSDYSEKTPRFRVLCEGFIPDVVPGVPLELDFNEKFDSFEQAFPVFDDHEYSLYLLSTVKGISTLTAERILDVVNGDLKVLNEKWDDTAFWRQFRGSKRYINELKIVLGDMFEKEKIFQKYRRYGIGYREAEQLIRFYGMNAENKLLEDPYKVMRLLGMEFITADVLAHNLGYSAYDEKRITDVIIRVLTLNEQNGNTAMYISKCICYCNFFLKHSEWPNIIISESQYESVMKNMSLVYREDKLCGLLPTYRMEKNIAWRIKQLSEQDTKIKLNDSDIQELGTHNEEQQQFLQVFASHSVTLLLGGPGTGKTHTICGAINLMRYKKPHARICLCAPTARAAGVLKEKSGQKATTIHVLLGIKGFGGIDMEKNDKNPIDADMIIVDEMSMVGTELFCLLLQAVKNGTKLILSGDPEQLESVDAGAVLRDLINSTFIPKVTLTQIMRQEDGSAIVENCVRILQGRTDLLQADEFIYRRCLTEKEGLAYLLSKYPGRGKDTQILSITKKGLLGTEHINKIFEQKDDGAGIYIKNNFFHEGDKIVFVRNNYPEGYCNGDIGYIKAIHNTFIEIDVTDGAEDSIGTVVLKQEFFYDICHAECITIHKSQGSEYTDVFILLPNNPVSLLNRNILNTGISRARRRVFLIEVGDAVKTAACNQYKAERITQLPVFIRRIEKNLP